MSAGGVNVLAPAFSHRPYVDGDRLDFGVPLVWTVDDFLSPAECAELIARIEREGPAAAPITTSRGFEMRPDIRNNERVMFDDGPLAGELFARAKGLVPERMNGGLEAVAMNERFRCYRYRPGQTFAPHYDGAFARPGQRSLLTCVVYLNDDFEGGTTPFLTLEVTAEPKTGRALFFQHQLLHEGAMVVRGVKYAARSDVMYTTARRVRP